jgi:penicillin-binding protein 1A
MAGKTGTTNDNSDAWFMGYTPQLLAGGWVGCDDRFIRFNTESKNGEGGRAAMPIWAYFMRKAAADPNCGLDTKLSFVKPENMAEINIEDNANILPGEGDGPGNEQQYELPKSITKDDISAESEIPVDQKKAVEKPKTTTPPPPPVQQPPKKNGENLMPPKKSNNNR